MPYPINQRAHQFNSIQSVPVSFGLWDTALKFLSPGPRNDVTDHLDGEDLNQERPRIQLLAEAELEHGTAGNLTSHKIQADIKR